MAKDKNKPKGPMTAYAIFVQHERDDLKKKNPNKNVEFAVFSKECSAKWANISAKDKKKFQDLAAKDKERHEKEMKNYSPGPGGEKKKKKEKDPNAPKRPQPAFFLFSSDERSKVRAEHPEWTVGEVAKELGHRWEACKNRAKYETMAAAEKAKYEKAMAKYKAGN